jgi:hypothetical protein
MHDRRRDTAPTGFGAQPKPSNVLPCALVQAQQLHCNLVEALVQNTTTVCCELTAMVSC